MVSSQYGVEVATELVAVVDVDEVFEEIKTVEDRVLLTVGAVEDVTDESPETFCTIPSSDERKITNFILKRRN